MKIFVVSRTDTLTWCEDFKATVVAEDALRAKEIASKTFSWVGDTEYDDDNGQIYHNDFPIEMLEAKEIDLNEENIYCICNTGA